MLGEWRRAATGVRPPQPLPYECEVMFQTWRWKIRQADEACEHGRLDEACRLLAENNLRDYQPGQRLVDKLADCLLTRSQQRAEAADSAGAWKDFDTAKGLVGESSRLLELQAVLIRRELTAAETCLRAGNSNAALAAIENLERRKIAGDELRSLKEIARRMESARNLSLRGKFPEAESQLQGARSLRPEWPELESQLQACRGKADHCRTLTEKLHTAVADSAWSKAVSLADELLELAPEFRLAKDARKRAWAEVGTKLADSHQLAVTQHWSPSSASPKSKSSQDFSLAGESSSAQEKTSSRFLLWIDAVGGYLVCLANEIVLGQATPGNRVDVPIMGDLSRRHAIVRRHGEGYVIEPIHTVRVQGQKIGEATLLSDGDEIELGNSVRLRFRKPHVLSASARLEFVSRHRTQPSADGILLMAESCVLGPKFQNHVVCRSWSHDVVLYRQEDELFCRAMESIEIDGQLCDGRGRIGSNSRVSGGDFALSLELV